MSTTEDDLTGLLHRRGFLATLRQQVSFSNDRQTLLALVVCDIDGFARLNAAHGYEFGDQALQYVAQHVRSIARPQDYVARIGDNRFALLLTRIMNPGHAELAIQQLLRHLEVPFQGRQGTVRLNATIGAGSQTRYLRNSELPQQHRRRNDHQVVILEFLWKNGQYYR